MNAFWASHACTRLRTPCSPVFSSSVHSSTFLHCGKQSKSLRFIGSDDVTRCYAAIVTFQAGTQSSCCIH